MLSMENHSLPLDALDRIKDRLKVTISVLSSPRPWHTFLFWKREVVDSFTSREDLIETLAASSSIPGFTAPLEFPYLGIFGHWRNQIAVDGGVTFNTPIFTDGLRPQLLINLGFLDHPHLYTFSPLDPHHEKIVQQGQDDIRAVMFCGVPRHTNSSDATCQGLLNSTNLGLRPTIEFLLPEDIPALPRESSSPLAQLARFYAEIRQRLEWDAVPWLRVVCVEGGIALRIYRIFGIEDICTMPTLVCYECIAATLVLCFGTFGSRHWLVYLWKNTKDMKRLFE